MLPSADERKCAAEVACTAGRWRVSGWTSAGRAVPALWVRYQHISTFEICKGSHLLCVALSLLDVLFELPSLVKAHVFASGLKAS